MVPGKIFVSGLLASTPVTVVIKNDDAAHGEIGKDPCQAGLDRLVPVDVHMGKGDGAGNRQRVLHQPLDQGDGILRARKAKIVQIAPDHIVKVFLVAVIGIAADPGRGAGMDDPPAVVHLRRIVGCGRRDHGEDIIKGKGPLPWLAMGDHGGRTAQRAARFDEGARNAGGGNLPAAGHEAGGLAVGQIGQAALPHTPQEIALLGKKGPQGIRGCG